MANIALVTAAKVEIVESFEQMTAPAEETIVAGAPVRLNTSTGKFSNANAGSAAEARVYGIATKSVIAGQALTAIRRGVMDGFAFTSGTDFFEDVWLSDTDGRIADAAGTVAVSLGKCIPGTSVTTGTTYDKLFLVEVGPTATGATYVIPDADSLTVGGVIVPQHLEVSFHAGAAALMVDQSFFIANRAYEVVAAKEIHAVAESTAGSLKIQVTKDTGTDAPGAGTDLLTNNTNTGFDGKATANTVQSGTLTATGASLQLAAGDRLSVDFSAGATELVGVTITVSLKRI